MARSMTAFGAARVKTSIGRFLIEIHCLNRKTLDISLSLPRDWLRFDPKIRKKVGESFFRGQVTIQITRDPTDAKLELPSIDILKKLKQEWEKMAKELNFDPNEIDLSFIRQEYQNHPLARLPLGEKDINTILNAGVKQALQECIKMREKEGAFLSKDIAHRMKEISKIAEEINTLSKESPETFRERLMKKLKNLGIDTLSDDKEILKEVIAFTERLDISEEITRIKSHLKQFFDLLKTKEKSIGRTLDFLIQEMNREINTISSKSIEIEISRFVVAVKSELEKVREQVQNIE